MDFKQVKSQEPAGPRHSGSVYQDQAGVHPVRRSYYKEKFKKILKVRFFVKGLCGRIKRLGKSRFQSFFNRLHVHQTDLS